MLCLPSVRACALASLTLLALVSEPGTVLAAEASSQAGVLQPSATPEAQLAAITTASVGGPLRRLHAVHAAALPDPTALSTEDSPPSADLANNAASTTQQSFTGKDDTANQKPASRRTAPPRTPVRNSVAQAEAAGRAHLAKTTRNPRTVKSGAHAAPPAAQGGRNEDDAQGEESNEVPVAVDIPPTTTTQRPPVRRAANPTKPTRPATFAGVKEQQASQQRERTEDNAAQQQTPDQPLDDDHTPPEIPPVAGVVASGKPIPTFRSAADDAAVGEKKNHVEAEGGTRRPDEFRINRGRTAGGKPTAGSADDERKPELKRQLGTVRRAKPDADDEASHIPPESIVDAGVRPPPDDAVAPATSTTVSAAEIENAVLPPKPTRSKPAKQPAKRSAAQTNEVAAEETATTSASLSRTNNNSRNKPKPPARKQPQPAVSRQQENETAAQEQSRLAMLQDQLSAIGSSSSTENEAATEEDITQIPTPLSKFKRHPNPPKFAPPAEETSEEVKTETRAARKNPIQTSKRLNPQRAANARSSVSSRTGKPSTKSEESEERTIASPVNAAQSEETPEVMEAPLPQKQAQPTVTPPALPTELTPFEPKPTESNREAVVADSANEEAGSRSEPSKASSAPRKSSSDASSTSTEPLATPDAFVPASGPSPVETDRVQLPGDESQSRPSRASPASESTPRTQSTSAASSEEPASKTPAVASPLDSFVPSKSNQPSETSTSEQPISAVPSGASSADSMENVAPADRPSRVDTAPALSAQSEKPSGPAASSFDLPPVDAPKQPAVDDTPKSTSSVEETPAAATPPSSPAYDDAPPPAVVDTRDASNDTPRASSDDSVVDTTVTTLGPSYKAIQPARSTGTGLVIVVALLSFLIFIGLKLKKCLAAADDEVDEESQLESGTLLNGVGSSTGLANSTPKRPLIRPGSGQVVVDALTDEEDGWKAEEKKANSANNLAGAPPRGMSLKAAAKPVRGASTKAKKAGLGARQLSDDD